MNYVLVVDDCTTDLKIISYILKASGLHVDVAVDGIKALARLQQQIPDLVVTDIEMPQMNGYELCRWCKDNPATQNVPIVICSSKDEEFERDYGIQQGADAYLIKPFRASELVSTVKHLLQGQNK